MQWTGLGVVMILITACGGGGGGDPDARADANGDGGGDSAYVGQILIEETELGFGDSAYVTAAFNLRAANPDLAGDGTCRVFEYPCLGNVGACSQPTGYSAGEIALTGLNVPVTLVPDPETHSYWASVPDDVFAPGATITATADGDTIGGFDLSTMGVEPLVSPYVGTNQPRFAGTPVTYTWTGSSDARVRLHVNWANLCHAGATWYVLECDVPDTGSLTVEPAVSNALPATGFGGCGATLTRYRSAVGSTAEADVELFVGSTDFFDVGGPF